MSEKGIFIISLDFELYWGELDLVSLEGYKENLLGVRSAVPALLKLFNEYDIHATWATVGFLFFETRNELVKALPNRKPNYVNSRYSTYDHIKNIGPNEKKDPFHYAPSLIKMIASSPNQEVGIHTFCHYYCLERGQDIHAFKDDLEAAIKVAKRYNIAAESLIFPRNQFNKDYISVCKEMGIKAYRGNPPSWMYRARRGEQESLFIRGQKLIDTYLNVSGYNSYSIDEVRRYFPFNIPGSRFLRPYSEKLKILEPLRLKRILSELTYAAKKGLIYHLWWHPHNFGVNLEENLLFLKKILNHYKTLRQTHEIESLNMGELSHSLLKETNRER